jgi:hypothetical protein
MSHRGVFSWVWLCPKVAPDGPLAGAPVLPCLAGPRSPVSGSPRIPRHLERTVVMSEVHRTTERGSAQVPIRVPIRQQLGPTRGNLRPQIYRNLGGYGCLRRFRIPPAALVTVTAQQRGCGPLQGIPAHPGAKKCERIPADSARQPGVSAIRRPQPPSFTATKSTSTPSHCRVGHPLARRSSARSISPAGVALWPRGSRGRGSACLPGGWAIGSAQRLVAVALVR